MALQIVCDGCLNAIENGREFDQGQYNKVQYCQKCNEIYLELFEAPIRAERANLASRFEAFIATCRADMKEISNFKKLPDEADDGEESKSEKENDEE